jgi:hypothetical protein
VGRCTVTSTTGCVTFTNATMPSEEGSGNSITLTGTTSFVDTCPSSPCFFPAPNTLATGGGTYTETNSTGMVISSGIYRIADTAGTPEGLFFLEYHDGNSNVVSSCALATGTRVVGVIATLIDGTTQATQTAHIFAATGTDFNPPVGEVDTGNDLFIGNLSSSTVSLTC